MMSWRMVRLFDTCFWFFFASHLYTLRILFKKTITYSISSKEAARDKGKDIFAVKEEFYA
jgi:hypothetical protein